jgi:hypothetical protein
LKDTRSGVDQYLKWARDEYDQDIIPQEIKEVMLPADALTLQTKWNT